MYASSVRGSKLKLAALSGAVALALVAGSAQAQISQSAERKNINRLGHTDLQGRPSYQPNVIQYPGRALRSCSWAAQQRSGARGGCSDRHGLPEYAAARDRRAKPTER